MIATWAWVVAAVAALAAVVALVSARRARRLADETQRALAQAERSLHDQRASLEAADAAQRERIEQVAASERRFRSLAIAASALVFYADSYGRVRAAPGWTEFTGQSERETIGDGWLDAVHPDDRTRVSDAWARARARNEQVELECRLRTASGAWRFVAIRAVPIHDEHGSTVSEWIGMVRDVHNRRHAQAMLAAREQEMRLILDHTDARIAYVTADRRFRWANQSFCHWHGRSTHEITGAALDEVLDAPEAAAYERRLSAARSGRTEQFELREDHPSLGERWSLSTVTPDLSEDGSLVGCIVLSVDTTVRRQMEEAIRRSEAEHRALTEHVPHLVWIADAGGRVNFCNRRWHHYTGLGTGVDWRAAVHPDDAAAVADAWQVALARGEALDVEARYRSRDGEQRWHMMRAIPITGANGAVERWYGSCTDIEDVKHAQGVLESAAQQTQSFLAMLSHELRNPLTAITMASQILSEPRARESQRDTARQTIQRQSQLLRRVIDDLLEIARVTHGHIELKRETVDLGATVALVCRDLEERTSRFGVSLRCDVGTEPIYVDADPARIQQMVDNLVSNAVRASEPGRAVDVRVHGDAAHARITVSDDGRGIEPSLLRSIFDPFVRGESNRIEGDLRPGLGLGLTIVRRLAELHGGEVRAASLGVGHGAMFTLEFPRIAAPVSTDATVATDVSPDAGGRVLVIDDERESADALQAVLELHGFDVATAYDGVQGLERCRDHQPAVVVCDLGLPEPLDGYGVAQTIVQRARATGEERPYLIAFSGYGRPEDVQHARESGFDTHLLKPASASDILHRIEAGLRRRP